MTEFVPGALLDARHELCLPDLAVLICFIHHIATQIQLPEVIAGISAACPGPSTSRWTTGRPVPGTRRQPAGMVAAFMHSVGRVGSGVPALQQVERGGEQRGRPQAEHAEALPR